MTTLTFKATLEDDEGTIFAQADYEIEEIQGFKCADCDEVAEEALDGPLYECGNCGTKFIRDNSADGGSHKCPDCNKFAGKLLDADAKVCASCETAEAEPHSYYECCGTQYDVESEPEALLSHLGEMHVG